MGSGLCPAAWISRELRAYGIWKDCNCCRPSTGTSAGYAGWTFFPTTRVWDILDAVNSKEPREKYIYRGHEDAVPTVVFSHDCRHLLSGSHDKTLRYWNVETETSVHCLKGHEGPVNSVALSSDNQWA